MSQTTRPLSGPLGKAMIVGMWVALLALLTWFFADFLEEQYNPNQRVATSVSAGGVAETVLQRNRYGHYVATGKINNATVRFLIDTGASDVNIPADIAERLALRRGAAQYASTANGTITVYATRLDTVALGNVVLRDVRASINPHMHGEDILLGMSFLKDLELVQRGDKLLLRQYR